MFTVLEEEGEEGEEMMVAVAQVVRITAYNIFPPVYLGRSNQAGS
jgi:hypothetical protein